MIPIFAYVIGASTIVCHHSALTKIDIADWFASGIFITAYLKAIVTFAAGRSIFAGVAVRTCFGFAHSVVNACGQFSAGFAFRAESKNHRYNLSNNFSANRAL